MFATESGEVRVGRFVLGEPIGRGGAGTVFRAHDPDLGRAVALKVFGSSDDEVQTKRLLDEAKTLARLNHPNVVTVYECGMDRGRVYIAMELIEGGTLSDWVRANPAGDPSRFQAALDLMVQATSGLRAAHALGLVHRDLKPNNMLVDAGGRLRIADFGLARSVVDASLEAATASGDQGAEPWTSPVGTPRYMAPEQLAGRPTYASDQFSVCATFYRVFLGATPFAGDTDQQRLEAIRSGRFQPPLASHHVPRWLRHVLETGLQGDPGRRFPDVGALEQALLRGRRRPLRRRRIISVSVGALVVAGATAGLVTALEDAPPSPCRDGDAQWEGVWSERRAQRLEARATESGSVYSTLAWPRVEQFVEQWGQAWTQEYREACEATKVREEEPEVVMQARTLCLRHQLVNLDATLESVGSASAAAVVSALSELSRPMTCRGQTGEGEVVDASVQQGIDDVLQLLQGAKVALLGAELERALQTTEDAVVLARGLTHEPTLARTLTVHAEILQRNGKPFEAEAREAVQLAAELDLPAIETTAWLMVSRAADGKPDADKRASDTSVALDAARASLVRAGTPPNLAARVTLRRAETAHVQHSDLETGAALYAEALELYRSAPNPSLSELGYLVDNYAQLLSSLGRNDEGLELIRWRLQYAENLLGAEHPECGHARYRLGLTLMNLGDLDGAASEAERAVKIYVDAQLEDIFVAGPYGLLSAVAITRREWPQARVYAQRNLDIYTEHYKGVGMTASAIDLLGELELRAGNPAQAKRHFERAIAIAEDSYGPENPWMESLRESLGRAELDLGDPQAALELFELVVPGLKEVYGDDTTAVLPVMAKSLEALVMLGDSARARTQLERIERVRDGRRLGLSSTTDVELAIATYELSTGDTAAAHDRVDGLRTQLAAAEGAAAEPLLFQVRSWQERHL